MDCAQPEVEVSKGEKATDRAAEGLLIIPEYTFNHIILCWLVPGSFSGGAAGAVGWAKSRVNFNVAHLFSITEA